MTTVLEKLLLKMIAAKLRVRISCKGVGNGNGEEGFYDSDKKEIEIFVDIARGRVDANNASSVAQNSPNPIFECLILAHEFGHFLSEEGGRRPVEYNRLRFIPSQSWPQLPKEEREIIFNEEVTAWNYAKETLDALGFFDGDSFCKKEEAALAEYKRRLDLS